MEAIGRGAECILYRVESEMEQKIVIKLLSPEGRLVEEQIIPLDLSISSTPGLPRLTPALRPN